jgi:hypothetical protein
MWYRLAGCLILICGTAACGGKQVDTTIPLDEARVLNSEITSRFVRTQSLLEESSVTARTLSELPSDIAVTDFDADLVREVLAACFTSSVVMSRQGSADEVPRAAVAETGPDHRPLTERPPVGRVLPCAPSRMHALESYVTSAQPSVHDFLMERVLAVDALRVDLNDTLVAQLNELEDTADEVRAESERLRGVAEERRATAQSSSTDDLARRQNELDYDSIIGEFDQIMAVLDQIDNNLADMRQVRRQLIEEATRNIAMLGASGT